MSRDWGLGPKSAGSAAGSVKVFDVCTGNRIQSTAWLQQYLFTDWFTGMVTAFVLFFIFFFRWCQLDLIPSLPNFDAASEAPSTQRFSYRQEYPESRQQLTPLMLSRPPAHTLDHGEVYILVILHDSCLMCFGLWSTTFGEMSPNYSWLWVPWTGL